MSKTCLIIGAGMAGLTAAAELTTHAWDVTILDKGRSVGGRLATRRIGSSRLDHGAQFFTTRSPEFRSAVDEWQTADWVVPWYTEDGHTRYRAVGGMNALAKQLALHFHVQTETKIQTVAVTGTQWQASAESGASFQADALILTPPAPQSIALLGDIAPEVTTALSAIEYDPCFALLLTLDGPSLVPAPGYLRPADGVIDWLADNTQKGVSEGPAAITIHAGGAFTRQHLETPHDEVIRLLLEAAAPYFGSEVTATNLHRWLYAKPVADTPLTCLFSARPSPLAVAGDALAGSRVEGAFLSGLAAARRINLAY